VKIKFFSKEMMIRLSYMLSIAILGTGYYVLNTYRGRAYILEHPIDSLIPFSKYFAIPYLLWYYPLLIIAGISLAYNNYSVYKRFIVAINLGMLFSFIVYYIYPTTVPRPDVDGKDFYSFLVQQIYKKDNPYNCFPSIHVIKSLIISFYITIDNTAGKIYKGVVWFANITIILSTMLIKQHYFYDAVGGLVVTVMVYYIADYLESHGYLSGQFIQAKLSIKRFQYKNLK